MESHRKRLELTNSFIHTIDLDHHYLTFIPRIVGRTISVHKHKEKDPVNKLKQRCDNTNEKTQFASASNGMTLKIKNCSYTNFCHKSVRL